MGASFGLGAGGPDRQAEVVRAELPSPPAPFPWSMSSPPLLLHFDVNKTVILTDSIDARSHEDSIREAVCELFWGWVRQTPDGPTWTWLAKDYTVRVTPPTVVKEQDCELLTYGEYCKKVTKDKKELKTVSRSFSLTGEGPCKERMERLVYTVIERMQLPNDLQNSQRAEDVGLKGTTIMMLPAVFELVARLARSKRPFAVMFRSFGKDHDKIKKEWNAFCELRHPLYSHLIDDIGPFDGTVAGCPDRRLHNMHTLYRDAEGPVLALDTFTNGPEDKTWDSWAKQKPKAETDTRGGRQFLQSMGAKTINGTIDLQKWFESHLNDQRTQAIKDDWAWWTWHGESSDAGKLMLVGLSGNSRQLFFDDNIDHVEPRIVDCRGADGGAVPLEHTMNRLCTKVSPVEALVDDEYFLRVLERCHGESLGLRPPPVRVEKEEDVAHGSERFCGFLCSGPPISFC